MGEVNGYRLELRSAGRDHRLIAYAEPRPAGGWRVSHIPGGWHVVTSGPEQATALMVDLLQQTRPGRRPVVGCPPAAGDWT